MALLVDDILALLPEAELRVWRFDQGGYQGCWEAILEGHDARGMLELHTGNGDTPVAALCQAFERAGFKVEDDGT